MPEQLQAFQDHLMNTILPEIVNTIDGEYAAHPPTDGKNFAIWAQFFAALNMHVFTKAQDSIKLVSDHFTTV